MYEAERRVVAQELMDSVYVLNTWTDTGKQEVREKLEAGLYVHLGCSATGHTLSQMVESAGFRWTREEYGDRLEVVWIKDDWTSPRVHLISIEE